MVQIAFHNESLNFAVPKEAPFTAIYTQYNKKIVCITEHYTLSPIQMYVLIYTGTGSRCNYRVRGMATDW